LELSLIKRTFNAIIHFEYKASKEVGKVVFTVNSKDGHVFRFVTGEVTAQ